MSLFCHSGNNIDQTDDYNEALAVRVLGLFWHFPKDYKLFEAKEEDNGLFILDFRILIFNIMGGIHHTKKYYNITKARGGGGQDE